MEMVVKMYIKDVSWKKNILNVIGHNKERNI